MFIRLEEAISLSISSWLRGLFVYQVYQGGEGYLSIMLSMFISLEECICQSSAKGGGVFCLSLFSGWRMLFVSPVW